MEVVPHKSGRAKGQESQKKKNKENGVSYKEFIDRAKKIHGDTYDYSGTVVSGIKNRVDISCRIHGVFTQMCQAHIINGQGCPDCFKHERLLGEKINLENYKSQFNRVVLRKRGLDISISGIFGLGIDEDTMFMCNTHDCKFISTQRKVLSSNSKYHCSKCSEFKEKMRIEKITTANKRGMLSQDQFLERSKSVHGERYCYEKSVYTGIKNDVVIECKIHGSFNQKPREHWGGCGCNKCSNAATSNKEKDWISSLGEDVLPNERIYYSGDKYYTVDGLDKENKIVYEFLGDYWHGNPVKYKRDEVNGRTKKTFGQMYDETFERINLIENLGYKVIYKWEYDYDKDE